MSDSEGKADTNSKGSKQTRLRKACDSCSLRKVKCDAVQPCKPCKALDIPCTFNRPSRRRGPPNRLAENIKKEYQYIQQDSPTSPSPPRSNHEQPTLSVEAICPLQLVRLLVDDYFAYMHPLQPFPHEPSYRKALDERRDLHDPRFVALTAALIGSLVASYPRRPCKRLKSSGYEHLFSRSVDFVCHCQRIISEARGPGYLEKPDLNADDAATSYCLLTMCASTFNWQQADLYFGECFTMVRCLLARKSNTERALSAQGLKEAELGAGASEGVIFIDLIELEMTRRVFWTAFVTIRSAKTFGALLGDIGLRAPTASQDYPPLPLEVDDEYIHSNYIEPQPHDILPQITGFNTNVRIYMTFDPIVALEDAYRISHAISLETQKAILRECIDRVKHCFDELPESLLVWLGPPSSTSSSGFSGIREYENGTDARRSSFFGGTRSPGSQRTQRKAVTEIQKANIHASYLSSRSYFVEKYWSFMNARGGMDSITEAEIRQERASIAEDLLKVLSSISPVHMEPNSVSFNMKIRQIASTLLPSAGTGPAILADDGLSAFYLRAFLDILMQLEKCNRLPSSNERHPQRQEGDMDMDVDDSESEDDSDEEELRAWANLREQQREFVKSGASIAGV